MTNPKLNFVKKKPKTALCSNNIGRRLKNVEQISPNSLAYSLLAIAAEHNALDSLLSDLLKRKQISFGGQGISPWAVKTKFSLFYAKHE